MRRAGSFGAIGLCQGKDLQRQWVQPALWVMAVCWRQPGDGDPSPVPHCKLPTGRLQPDTSRLGGLGPRDDQRRRWARRSSIQRSWPSGGGLPSRLWQLPERHRGAFRSISLSYRPVGENLISGGSQLLQVGDRAPTTGCPLLRTLLRIDRKRHASPGTGRRYKSASRAGSGCFAMVRRCCELAARA